MLSLPNAPVLKPSRVFGRIAFSAERPRSRIVLMALLVAAFLTQTALVYTDDTGRDGTGLSALAQDGRGVWLDNNCQSCHQLYGFGGFLGPDLTNAARRLTDKRLDEILTVGAGQMPAFGLSAGEISSVRAWLTALDATGVGQLRAYESVDPLEAIDAVATRAPIPAGAFRGRALFAESCVSCHALCRPNLVNGTRAPDLTETVGALPAKEIREVLLNGRPDRGMPADQVAPDDVDSMLAFLRWMNDRRADLQARVPQPGGDPPVPWFTYP